ncbi:DUF397 domain-containing protein [Streptomyces sp. T-3]|nr:DUF397 domain-containing protein [Streptomyces sp. T-3]
MPAPLGWQKSSFSGGGADEDCVELAVAVDAHAICLRESETPTKVLSTTGPALHALLGAIKASPAAM